MKSALFLFVYICIINSISFSLNAQEVSENFPITKNSQLKDFESLQTLRDFLSEVHEDLETYYLISERNLKLPSNAKCEIKQKADVIKLFSNAFKKTLKFYPDEELPISEALNELKVFFNAAEVEVCSFSKFKKDVEITHSLFYSKTSSFFLRLDFFSPVK